MPWLHPEEPGCFKRPQICWWNLNLQGPSVALGTKSWLHKNKISQTVAQGNGAVRPTTPTELKDRVRERIFNHQLEQAVGGRSPVKSVVAFMEARFGQNQKWFRFAEDSLPHIWGAAWLAKFRVSGVWTAGFAAKIGLVSAV